MRRGFIGIVMVTMLMAGCAAPSDQSSVKDDGNSISPTPAKNKIEAATRPAAAGEQIAAAVNGRSISMRQLQAPLIEAYGLNFLLHLAQLELAKQEAEQKNIIVSEEDIRIEREQTLSKMFEEAEPKDYPELLEQFYKQQRITPAEFDLVLQANAYLRKIAEPMLINKISEENLRQAFGILYGENVKVRHIQVANVGEIVEAKRRLAVGEPFEKVARDMSRDPQTGPLGGELPQFSRTHPGLPEVFKEAAFALKEGEVSEPVQIKGGFHLIKQERRIEPKAVKFDGEMKEIVRKQLYDELMQKTIAEMRARLAQTARQTMKIEIPVLKKQFEERMNQQPAAQSREEVIEEMRQDQAAAEQRQAPPQSRPAEEIPLPDSGDADGSIPSTTQTTQP